MGKDRGWWRFAREYLEAVRPAVARGLEPIRRRAEAIPDPRLKAAALESLRTKTFHCEGGGVLAGPSRDPTGQVLPVILAYQTLCDYLDTLTDRGPSRDPENLRALHEALEDAVRPGAAVRDYYRHHPDRQDGGYLVYLVTTCQEGLGALAAWPARGEPRALVLVRGYAALQVAKHGPVAQRREQLYALWRQGGAFARDLHWWEYTAALGSTLALFVLAAELAAHPQVSDDVLDALVGLYHPWMGCLHILLDYWVDRAEDARYGDFNFVDQYPSPAMAAARLADLVSCCLQRADALPDAAFHRYVARGLVAFYLADRKVGFPPSAESRALLVRGGFATQVMWILAHWARAI
ncbi:MAG: tetraprenyl-beta-curcumene synthase family protein [Firmicutes bacterium]|nr:DUF2600 family protein [Alicyclobacillaceae bacterium]MCL6497811.1 tetraprenyl-beta-curcumene synthase family protein [Bacillota bacterium]